jgi:hypothetical protein
MRAIPDDNLSYPVLLEIGQGSGSGFHFRNDEKIFLVTALHVLYEDDKKTLRGSSLKLTSYDKDVRITKPIERIVDLQKVKIRKNDSKDIALVELASISKTDHEMRLLDGVKRVSDGKSVTVTMPETYLKKFKDVLISNDVYILGYPSSLGSQGQIELNKPLLRKGIVAGKNMKNETIILDCPVYFGNSGGLAIEVEKDIDGNTKYRAIGVVSQYIPFVEKLTSELGYTNLNCENSGYSVVVPIDTILELSKEEPEK